MSLSKRHISHYISYLSSNEPQIRCHALNMLSFYEVQIPLSVFESLIFDSSSEVKKSLLRYAFVMNDSERRSLLMEVLENDCENLHPWILPLLKETEPDHQLLKKLLKILPKINEPRLLAKFLASLEQYSMSIPVDFFQVFLKSENLTLLKGCLESLKCGAHQSLTPLFRELLNHKNWNIKITSAVCLWKQGIPAILNLAPHIPENYIVDFLDALGETGEDPRIMELLIRYLHSKKEAWRISAANSLCKLKYEDTLEDIVFLAADEKNTLTATLLYKSALSLDAKTTTETLDKIEALSNENPTRLQRLELLKKLKFFPSLQPETAFKARKSRLDLRIPSFRAVKLADKIPATPINTCGLGGLGELILQGLKSNQYLKKQPILKRLYLRMTRSI
jgi:hypothetical protein